MARFLSSTGSCISGTLQRLPLGDSMTIGVSDANGLSVVPDDPSIAGLIDLGADSTNNRWFKLTARRVAGVRIEARRADDLTVQDFFELSVLRETPQHARAEGALDRGPDYPSDPSYIDRLRSARYDLRTSKLTVEHCDGSWIELDPARIQRDMNRPGVGSMTLEAHARSAVDGKIYPRWFDRISAPNIAAIASEIARAVRESESLLRSGQEILRLVPVTGPVPGGREIAWTKAAPTARETAESLAARLRSAGQRVVVNIGGTGEVPNAINVNPHLVAPDAWIPSLVRVHAERLGELFPPDSIDTIVSYRLPPNTLNWAVVLQGAHKVMKPGAPITLRFQGTGNDARAILLSFQHLRFRHVKNLSGSELEAIK